MAGVSEPSRKSRMFLVASATKSSSFSCERGLPVVDVECSMAWGVERSLEIDSEVEKEGWRLSCLCSSNCTSPESIMLLREGTKTEGVLELCL